MARKGNRRNRERRNGSWGKENSTALARPDLKLLLESQFLSIAQMKMAQYKEAERSTSMRETGGGSTSSSSSSSTSSGSGSEVGVHSELEKAKLKVSPEVCDSFVKIASGLMLKLRDEMRSLDIGSRKITFEDMLTGLKFLRLGDSAETMLLARLLMNQNFFEAAGSLRYEFEREERDINNAEITKLKKLLYPPKSSK